MVQFTMVSGKIIYIMGKGYLILLMGLDMKGNGRIIWCMDLDNLEIFWVGNGKDSIEEGDMRVEDRVV